MSSLQNLIAGAGIPELKEILRQFEARCPRSRELSQRLSGTLDSNERSSREGLKVIVEGVCDRFTECEEIAGEILGIDEDDFPGRSTFLDESEDERDLEVEMPKKSKGKKRGRDILSSPPKPDTKRSKSNGPQNEYNVILQINPRTLKVETCRLPLDQNKMGSSSPAAPSSSASNRKRTVAEIFDADKKRRELEALQEKQRREEIVRISATCAQCKKFFLTDENPRNSCVFHPGTYGRHHPADDCVWYTPRWFCCGRDRSDEGCMEAKHVDDRIPGEVERIRAIRETAWEDARAVTYRRCAECHQDVVVEWNDEPESNKDSDYGSDDDDSVLDPEPQSDHGSENQDYILDPEHRSNQGSEDHDSELSQSDHEHDSESASDDSNTSDNVPDFPTPERFLCHDCVEKAAAKQIECSLCCDKFKALPSEEAYTAEKPICGRCWAANWRGFNKWCEKCEEYFEPQMRPHYSYEPNYWGEYEEDERFCPACTDKDSDDGEEEVSCGPGSFDSGNAETMLSHHSPTLAATRSPRSDTQPSRRDWQTQMNHSNEAFIREVMGKQSVCLNCCEEFQVQPGYESMTDECEPCLSMPPTDDW